MANYSWTRDGWQSDAADGPSLEYLPVPELQVVVEQIALTDEQKLKLVMARVMRDRFARANQQHTEANRK